MADPSVAAACRKDRKKENRAGTVAAGGDGGNPVYVGVNVADTGQLRESREYRKCRHDEEILLDPYAGQGGIR